MARPPEILVADEIVANPKLAHQAESPASSTGIPASHGNIPSYPLVPTTPASPVQHRRHGSIIKKTPRSDFAAKSTPSYRMRDRSAPRVGRWVFIVNGTKQKQWDELSSRLLRQLSGVEVSQLDARIASMSPLPSPIPLLPPVAPNIPRLCPPAIESHP